MAKSKVARNILITQCLQNDFFLYEDSKLCLPERESHKLLIGNQANARFTKEGTQRRLNKDILKKSPMGLFLENTIGSRLNSECQSPLYVINIRDMHFMSEDYTRERKDFGRHCQVNSKGANYVEGLEEYLDPDGQTAKPYPETGILKHETRWYKGQNIIIFHVASNSIFDFEVPKAVSGEEVDHKTDLELIINTLIYGNDETIELLFEVLNQKITQEAYYKKFEKPSEVEIEPYLLAIGVYTDIKVQMFLSTLRNIFKLSNMAVSDTLTASTSLERHLAGLDFVQKVLRVEIIHGIKNIVSYLGYDTNIENEPEVLMSKPFTDFSQYFYDKQIVLSHQEEKLKEYVQLTEERGKNLYNTVLKANKFLITWGKAFLFTSLAFALVSALLPLLNELIQLNSDGALSPNFELHWSIPAITGGIGLAQILSGFFSNPTNNLSKNFKDWVMMRMLLESHSLKLSLARFHLTTAEVLNENVDLSEVHENFESLKKQLDILEKIDKSNHLSFEKIGFEQLKKEKET